MASFCVCFFISLFALTWKKGEKSMDSVCVPLCKFDLLSWNSCYSRCCHQKHSKLVCKYAEAPKPERRKVEKQIEGEKQRYTATCWPMIKNIIKKIITM